MNASSGSAPLVVTQRVGVGIGISPIDLTGRHAVTEHFNHKALRHTHGTHKLGNRIVIGPIFEMMSIASLVVHPCVGKAVCLPFSLVGRSVALIVFCSRPKLGGAVFGQIVKQPLKADSGLEAVADHLVTVTGDGSEMRKRLHGCASFLTFEFFSSVGLANRENMCYNNYNKRRKQVQARFAMKILTIGNSFSANSIHYLPKIFESVGLPLTLGRVSIGGCPLHLHWYNAEHDIARYGLEYEGSFTMKQMLQSEPWDVVTLQQVSHLSWKIGTYFPYCEDLAAYARQHAPTARLAVQQTWAYRTDNVRLVNDMQITQNQMMHLIRENYREMSSRLGAKLMPVGEAFCIHQQLSGDTVGALTRNDDEPSHANALGRYIGGLTWFTCLTGISVDEVSFVPELVKSQDVSLAREAVKRAIALR